MNQKAFADNLFVVYCLLSYSLLYLFIHFDNKYIFVCWDWWAFMIWQSSVQEMRVDWLGRCLRLRSQDMAYVIIAWWRGVGALHLTNWLCFMIIWWHLGHPNRTIDSFTSYYMFSAKCVTNPWIRRRLSCAIDVFWMRNDGHEKDQCSSIAHKHSQNYYCKHKTWSLTEITCLLIALLPIKELKANKECSERQYSVKRSVIIISIWHHCHARRFKCDPLLLLCDIWLFNDFAT